MPTPVSLAAAQTVPVPGDVDANLAQHVELAEIAAAEGARVVVFPELSLTGYELERARDLAFRERDARLSGLTEVAAATHATLVVGAPILLDDRLHIGAFIVSPDGATDVYTKRHLGAFPGSVNPDGPVPPAEATVFQSGARDPLIDVDGCRATVAICADLGRPAHAERAANRGAHAYLVSAFVVPADLDQDMATLYGYARRHGMAVVFSNFGGPSGGLPSAGRSAIWSGSGELVVELEPEGKGVAVALEEAAGWRGKAVVPE